MTLISLKDVVGCEGYYIDDETFQIYSFKQDYKNGKLMKGRYTKDGYIIYKFYVHGKQKNIFYHTIIVKMFIKKDFNSNVEEIDHLDHNRTNNCIDNLCVVSHSDNKRNSSISKNGIIFNFVDNIGKSLVINEDAGIFYSLDLDKFFMQIKQSDKFKELHEYLHHGYPCIQYCYNNKKHMFRTTNFRKNLNKK